MMSTNNDDGTGTVATESLLLSTAVAPSSTSTSTGTTTKPIPTATTTTTTPVVVIAEWPTDALSYNLIGTIGQGAFATVWKAQKITTTGTTTPPNSRSTSTSAQVEIPPTNESSYIVENNVPTTTVSATEAAANLLLQQLSLEDTYAQQQKSIDNIFDNNNSNNNKPVSMSSRTTSESSSSTTTTSSSPDCAVKVLDLDHVDTNLSEIRLEVQAMRLLSHNNVLQCLTAFVVDRHLWLITPLMRKGSSLHCLQTARRVIRQQQIENFRRQYEYQQQQYQQHKQQYEHTFQQPPVPVSMEQHIMYILHETLLGLQYIHENGQIHRDIKAGNILLDDNGIVKIADFGVSGWLVQGGSRQEKAKTFVGTPCWMAPEVMEQVNGYDYKADIWSLGITALELARGYAPYAKYAPMKVLILTIQEEPPSLSSYDTDTEGLDEYDSYYINPETASMRIAGQELYSTNVFESFVATCLQKNPTKRPTCAELLANTKFFNNVTVSSSSSSYEQQRQVFVSDICSLVPDVGSNTSNNINNNNANNHHHHHHHMPGNTPISIILSQATDENRPAGTTWIFADGSTSNSQSIHSTSSSHQHLNNHHHHHHLHHHDDVLAELDEFERQTGGEHYIGPSTRSDSISNVIDNTVPTTTTTYYDDDNSSTCNEDTIRAGNQYIQHTASIEQYHEPNIPTTFEEQQQQLQQPTTTTMMTSIEGTITSSVQQQQSHDSITNESIQLVLDNSSDDADNYMKELQQAKLGEDNSTDTDDLDDFMNEFEQATSGEDFRKS